MHRRPLWTVFMGPVETGGWEEREEGGVGGGGSCTAQLWLWPGSNQNTGAVKAPLDESQGAVSGQNAGLGLKVQGYVLLLMRSTRWASRPRGPDDDPSAAQEMPQPPSTSKKQPRTTEASHASQTSAAHHRDPAMVPTRRLPPSGDGASLASAPELIPTVGATPPSSLPSATSPS